MRFHKPDGSTETIEFEKMINTTLLNVYKDRVLGPQFQNFINAAQCGYLEKMSRNIFGRCSWHRYFVVLSNVGIMYFTDPAGSPLELFQLLDCKFEMVDPDDVDGCTTAFRLLYPLQQVTFRCETLSEYD